MNLQLECEDDTFNCDGVSVESNPNKCLPEMRTTMEQRELSTTFKPRIASYTPTDGKEKERLYCEMCEASFTRNNLLLDHCARDHGKRNLFQCANCSFVAQRSRILQKHIYRKHRCENNGTEVAKTKERHVHISGNGTNLRSNESRQKMHDLKDSESGRYKPNTSGNSRKDTKEGNAYNILKCESTTYTLNCCNLSTYDVLSSILCDKAVPVSMVTNYNYEHTESESELSCSDVEYEQTVFTTCDQQQPNDHQFKSYEINQTSIKLAPTKDDTNSNLHDLHILDQGNKVEAIGKCNTSALTKDSSNKASTRTVRPRQRDNKLACSFVPCKKHFRDRHQLETHERVHTGQDAYKCLECAYTCKQRTAMRLHIISKHTPNVDGVL